MAWVRVGDLLGWGGSRAWLSHSGSVAKMLDLGERVTESNSLLTWHCCLKSYDGYFQDCLGCKGQKPDSNETENKKKKEPEERKGREGGK